MRKHRSIFLGKDARDKLLKGVNIAGSIAAKTLGPYGRNIALSRTLNRTAVLTDDGVSIMKMILLKDPTEHNGARVLIDASVKTNEAVGDGTTATVILAGA